MDKKEFDIIFDDSLKNYLALEKEIYEFANMYESNPDDRLKYVILKIIASAKRDNFVLLQMIDNYLTGELKVRYSNQLGAKLNDLHEIENKILELSRTK